jgi:hypothetical protein
MEPQSLLWNFELFLLSLKNAMIHAPPFLFGQHRHDARRRPFHPQQLAHAPHERIDMAEEFFVAGAQIVAFGTVAPTALKDVHFFNAAPVPDIVLLDVIADRTQVKNANTQRFWNAVDQEWVVQCLIHQKIIPIDSELFE